MQSICPVCVNATTINRCYYILHLSCSMHRYKFTCLPYKVNATTINRCYYILHLSCSMHRYKFTCLPYKVV